MELTRRDALIALAATGAAASTTLPVSAPTAQSLSPHSKQTLFDLAHLIYPSQVTNIPPFLETYLDCRTTDTDYLIETHDAVARLDSLGREWYDARFIDLEPATQDALLRDIGVDTAEADPDGSPAERIRYYLVNELQFALYSSPTGGRLVGIENPQGHPGGLASYQRSPSTDASD